MTSVYLELRPNSLRRPFRAFRNLDLEPRARALGTRTVTREAPKGAMQWVPVPKRRLMTSIYLELRSNSLRRPFRAFRNLDLNPGLAPWAVLLDPFGVLGFAPETSYIATDLPLSVPLLVPVVPGTAAARTLYNIAADDIDQVDAHKDPFVPGPDPKKSRTATGRCISIVSAVSSSHGFRHRSRQDAPSGSGLRSARIITAAGWATPWA